MGVRGARPWAALPSANKGETSVSIVDRILRIGEGRTLKRLDAIATRVEALADSYADFTDAELKEVTVELKERYADGESLDDLLPEAFAAVCEAAAVAVRRAVAKAVLAATPVAGIPTYREVFPSALP